MERNHVTNVIAGYKCSICNRTIKAFEASEAALLMLSIIFCIMLCASRFDSFITDSALNDGSYMICAPKHARIHTHVQYTYTHTHIHLYTYTHA